jgi:SnoaL-like domain
VLSAKAAIREVLENYCRAMDRIDVPLSRATWHPGGRAYYEGIFDGTGEEFCDWEPSFHRGFLSTSHEIRNCLVVVQADRAASETYVEFNLLRAEGERHILVTGHGRYLDKWSQRDGGWAIDDRHFVLSFRYEREVTARLGPARRDESDASYGVLSSLGQGERPQA